jgi:hypothetical protein
VRISGKPREMGHYAFAPANQANRPEKALCGGKIGEYSIVPEKFDIFARLFSSQ